MARKSAADPTGQAFNRRKAYGQLSKRLDVARKLVRRAFSEIPRTRRSKAKVTNAAGIVVSEAQVVFDYDLSPEELQALQIEVARIIDQQLETESQMMPPAWWFLPLIELPYRQGTVESLNEINRLIESAILAGVTVRGLAPQPIDADRVLVSPSFRNSRKTAQIASYGNVKSLGNTVAAQAIRKINTGVRAGMSPATIGENINERFAVADSTAKTLTRTDINSAYNNAKLQATNLTAEQTGLRPAVIHISALTPTTRTEHADRHGNAYTVEQQLEWWDTGANRINCLCDTESVFLDSEGNVVQKGLQQDIKRQGDKFFKKS